MSKVIILPEEPSKSTKSFEVSEKPFITRGEFWAACLLVATYDEDLSGIQFRQACSEAEASDVDIVTINMRGPDNKPLDDPATGHYFNTDDVCPLTSVLQQQELLKPALRHQPWVKATQVLESNGEYAAAKLLLNAQMLPAHRLVILDQIMSPTDVYIINWLMSFQASGINRHPANADAPTEEEISQGILLQLMGQIGRNIVAMINRSVEVETWALEQIQTVKLASGTEALFLPVTRCEKHLVRYQKEQRPEVPLLFWQHVDDRGVERGTCVRVSENHKDELNFSRFAKPDGGRYPHAKICYVNKTQSTARTPFTLKTLAAVADIMGLILGHQPLNNAFATIKVNRSAKRGTPATFELVKPTTHAEEPRVEVLTGTTSTTASEQGKDNIDLPASTVTSNVSGEPVFPSPAACPTASVEEPAIA